MKQPAAAMPKPRTPKKYPKMLFVVIANPNSIIEIPNSSILIPFISTPPKSKFVS